MIAYVYHKVNSKGIVLVRARLWRGEGGWAFLCQGKQEQATGVECRDGGDGYWPPQYLLKPM